MFDYKIDVKLSSEALKKGKKASAMVEFSDCTKKIAYCEGEAKKFNVKTKLSKVSDNKYSISGTIPFFVPKGWYEAEVYAVSTDGEKGPACSVKVQVI